MARQKLTMDQLLDRVEQRPSLLDLPDDALLTLEELAAYLGVSVSTIDKWIMGMRGIGTAGPPPRHKLHGGPKAPLRFMIRDVREWLHSCRVDPSAEGETPARCA